MAGKSPTSRTLELLRADGYHCGTVERWIQYAPGDPRRKFRPGEHSDLFGIIDIVAIRPGTVMGVQSTGSAFSQHVKKLSIEKEHETLLWLASGASLLLIGWRKVKKKRGGKQMVWKPRIGFFFAEKGKVIFDEYKGAYHEQIHRIAD